MYSSKQIHHLRHVKTPNLFKIVFFNIFTATALDSTFFLHRLPFVSIAIPSPPSHRRHPIAKTPRFISSKHTALHAALVMSQPPWPPRTRPWRRRLPLSPLLLLMALLLHRTHATSTPNASSNAPNSFSSFLRPDSLMGSGPRARSPPTASARAFTDQSAYVHLAASGALIATADFNRDRFSDLLMLDASTLRTLGVMLWDHDAFSFRHAGTPIRLDDPALAARETAAGLKPLGKIVGAHVADFGNDGTLDVLLYDGVQARIFFGSGDASFNAAPPALISQFPVVTALVDADSDLVPDIFAAFPNGTRGFYQYNRTHSVATNRSNQAGSVVFRAWSGGGTTAPGGAPCVTDVEMAAAIAFADMDGDCLADLVIPTTCGLEVWSNAATSHRPFWSLTAPHDLHRLGIDVYNFAHGDRAIAVADFDSDGTIDLAVANRNRGDLLIHLNRQRARPVGALCTGDAAWKLERTVGVSSGLSLRKPRLGSLFSAVDVPPLMHVGDFDLDGMPDILYIDSSSSQPVILRNRASWRQRRPQESHFQPLADPLRRGLAKGNTGAISATFFDTDESGRQDVLVVRGANETRLMWNTMREGWDALFFKGTMLSALGYRLEPRPFAPVVGNTLKISYMERGSRRRIRHVCSQCAQTGPFQLSACNCQFGLEGIANYIEELWAGGGSATRSWTSLMPNSMAVIWAGGDNSPGSWWMEYFTQRRGSQMLRVTAILMTGLVLLGIIILWLQHREAKEDRLRDELETSRLFNFVV